MRQKILLVVVTSLLLVFMVPTTAGAVTPASLRCDARGTIMLAALSQLNNAKCDYRQLRISVDGGRTFPVPRPGYSVQLSSLTVKGAVGVKEVVVSRSVKGEVAVDIGGALYGSSQARTDLRSIYPAPQSAAVAEAAGKCGNTKYSLLGFKWNGSYGWKYSPAGQPSSTTLNVMKRAAQAWVGFPAACGTTVSNNATQQYNGDTTGRPQVNENVTCGGNDGQSTIGWGYMNSSTTLAATCTWRIGSVPFDSDQNYNVNFQWSTSTTCAGSKFDVQGVATHEFGHSYGLGHVDQSTGQVMKPASPYCEVDQRNLGLGDVYGMKANYGG